jgi:hypothetical protein
MEIEIETTERLTLCRLTCSRRRRLSVIVPVVPRPLQPPPRQSRRHRGHITPPLSTGGASPSRCPAAFLLPHRPRTVKQEPSRYARANPSAVLVGVESHCPPSRVASVLRGVRWGARGGGAGHVVPVPHLRCVQCPAAVATGWP